ncbi:hypothetical protein [Teichococcus vastitatis]|uniref:Uncharacterized protein n=1 Tax=Teichococcus vastitatis TaxID=2307076 RepID=A0ABS9W8S3_9PROT|nr:hypothetical protein [Pseudoroseomonas vastitatis]MCI0755697.1 hypothetical protein [Pseudoroseomonas vastitatis]
MLPSDYSPCDRLLQALPHNNLDRLRPQMTLVQHSLRQNLHEPEAPIATVYFLETG